MMNDKDEPAKTSSKKMFYADAGAKPVVVRPDLDGIPPELKAARRWVVWRLVWNSAKGKWDKVPVDPRTNRNAKANRTDTWGAFEEAAAALATDTDLAGIGYEFEEGGGEFGVDLDDCRNPETGEIAAWAREVIDLFGTYAEVSPSGTGVKMIGRGKLPYARKLDDREAYDARRFFTLTGRRVPGAPEAVADCQPVLDAHFARLFPRTSQKGNRDRAEVSHRAGRVEPSDDKLVEKIRASEQGAKFAALFDRGDTTGHGEDDSRADLALCCILAWWTRKDPERIDRLFRRSKLCRGKWDEARGSGTYGSITVAEAIAVTEGEYDPAHRINTMIRGFVGEPVRTIPADANDPVPSNDVSSARTSGPSVAPGSNGSHDMKEAGASPGDGGGSIPPNGSEGGGGGGRPTAASRLVELAQEAGVHLFHTPDQEAYAQLPHDGHLEVHAVRGMQFRRFLTRLYFEAEGKAVNGDATANAINTLETIAVFSGPEHPVHRRVAPGPGGAIVLDLCDARWRSVVIRPGGWELTDCPPVMFTRSNVMYSLPEPARGGKLTDLRPFLNLKSHEDWLLVAAWLAAAIRPTGPYPLLHPKGEQGTAKTTFSKMLRRLFDPNKVDLRAQPREERDLAVSSKHGWALCYDNLSAVPLWLSDALCRVATGGGFGTRALFTNDEEITFDFVRPVLITSIEDVIGQPDLLDRSLALELEPIPDHKRLTEEALWAKFDAAKPGILSGLFDVVAKALELLPVVAAENPPVPRMADFALFGEAVARALGEPAGRFLDVLLATRSGADQDALQGSAVARTFYEWVQGQRTFTGTYTTLLVELNAVADSDDRKQKSWPKNPQALSGQIRRISPALRRLGVDISHDKVGHAKTRTVFINYDPAKARGTSSATPAGGPNPFASENLSADDAGDATSSAARPPRPPSSALFDDYPPAADDVTADAGVPRTIPSSALNDRHHKEVKRHADDADDVPHAVSAGSRIAEYFAPSANGRHHAGPADGIEEGEL